MDFGRRDGSQIPGRSGYPGGAGSLDGDHGCQDLGFSPYLGAPGSVSGRPLFSPVLPGADGIGSGIPSPVGRRHGAASGRGALGSDLDPGFLFEGSRPPVGRKGRTGGDLPSFVPDQGSMGTGLRSHESGSGNGGGFLVFAAKSGNRGGGDTPAAGAGIPGPGWGGGR